jgi:DNA-3-methyladenine glycosylase
MYWLLNVLLKGEEDGFVLIRAVEPTRGIDQMRQRRRQEKLTALCSGPGKLCQAFSITGEDHGRDLCEQARVGFRSPPAVAEVIEDVRVGISKAAHHPWRYLLRGSPYVSVAHGRAAKPRPRKHRT